MEKNAIFQQIADVWNTSIPFNQLLGLHIVKFDEVESEIHFKWQDKLIGNPMQKILHGGVAAAALDMAGGLVAAASIIGQMEEISPALVNANLSNLGTIDMRTDFLRPGRGESFVATARIIRGGNKVAVARMELHNEQGDHIAFGTGTYLVG